MRNGRNTDRSGTDRLQTRGRGFQDAHCLIADLNRRALLGSRRDGLRLELTYALHAREDVQELLRREKQCCGFLEFDLRADSDAIRLFVTAPETAREAAELVFEPFQSRSADISAASCGCGSGCTQ